VQLTSQGETQLKPYFAVSIVALIALVGYFTYLPTRLLLTNWNNIDVPTVQKHSQLELAKSGSWIQNGSLRLICSKRDNSLHLVQLTHITGQKPRTFDTSDSNLLIQKASKSDSDIKITFPDTSWYPGNIIDVMVTSNISAEQLSEMVAAFNSSPISEVIFAVSETAKGFIPTVDGSSIERMGRRCLEKID
jgi:hypothetical protein